ncbi:unnamed protein product [Rhizophagus irregularis]|uniref:Uncharacterized protein n=1 Tax=Rhizophagus irregularis TaxID=588596 RepID=A0A915YWU0_9GLOM|nr:unnamed protein product [Rhizophagus irregularis]
MSTNETFITEIQNFAYIILKYTEDNDIQDILILPFKSFTVLALTILSQKSSEALVGVNLEYTQNMDLVDDQSKYQSIIHVQTTTSIVDTSNSISMD